MSRPLHLRAGFLGLALLGGSCGTASREGLTLAVPDLGEFPLAIFIANILGAFLLGWLLDGLAKRGPDEGLRRNLRILLGTGFMGGFTTYSTLAAGTAQLFGDGSMGLGLIYALATVVLGALATWAGIVCASLTYARRTPPTTEETSVPTRTGTGFRDGIGHAEAPNESAGGAR